MGIPNECMSAALCQGRWASEAFGEGTAAQSSAAAVATGASRLRICAEACARWATEVETQRHGVSQRRHFVCCKVCLPVLFHRWEPSLAWSPFCKEFSFYTCHIGWNFHLHFFSRRSRISFANGIFAIWMYMVLLGGKHDILKNVAIVGMYVSTI